MKTLENLQIESKLRHCLSDVGLSFISMNVPKKIRGRKRKAKPEKVIDWNKISLFAKNKTA